MGSSGSYNLRRSQVNISQREMCQRIYLPVIRSNLSQPGCNEEESHWGSEDGLCSTVCSGQVNHLSRRLCPKLI